MKKLPTILIVEDEPAIAELISVNLRHNGFAPLWAEDGAAARVSRRANASSALRSRPEARSAATRRSLLGSERAAPLSMMERTVDVHVKRLREALGDAAAMVETVRGAGYRITAQPDATKPIAAGA